MKILVTGGAGYIGSHTIAALLDQGMEVVSMDNFSNSSAAIPAKIEAIAGRSHTFCRADLRDYAACYAALRNERGIDAVIHFAALKSVAESVAEPLRYYENNIGATVNLLRLMKELGIPSLIFSSSCTVYGQPGQLPVTESSPLLAAQSPYGSTKQVCEMIIRDAVHADASLSAILLRYFNPVGAHASAMIGEMPNGVPNNLVPYITQSAAGLRPPVKVFGNDYPTPDGTCIRDYIHVTDLAEAHLAAAGRLVRKENASGLEVFNIGTGKGVSVLEIIHAFEKVSGRPLAYEMAARRDGDIAQIWADTALAETVLGWKASRSLEDSLASAWAWEQQLGKGGFK